MKQEYLDYIKQHNPWVFSNEQFSMIMSDDWDSILSCALLQQIKGYQVGYFYDFCSLWKNKDATGQVCAIDISLLDSVPSWDNHVCLLHKDDSYNKQSVNLNLIDKMNPQNYEQKYSGSTLLQIWSAYDWPLPLSDEGRMILLAVDSMFLGFYSDYHVFRERNIYYLKEVLKFPELVDLMNKYDKQDFFKIIDKYNLKAKVSIDQGKLKGSGLKKMVFDLLELEPLKINNEFSKIKQFEIRAGNVTEDTYQDKRQGKYFSFALDYKKSAIYSVKTV